MTCTRYRDASALFGAVGLGAEDRMTAAGCGGGSHGPIEPFEGFWKAEVFFFRGSEGSEGAKLLPEDPQCSLSGPGSWETKPGLATVRGWMKHSMKRVWW